MKNLKRIISLICIATFMLSFSAFAFTADEEVPFKLKANKTTIAAGDTFTVTVYADVEATTYENAQAAMGNIDYNSSEFTVSSDGVDTANITVAGPSSGMNDKDSGVAIMYMSPITLDSTALFSFDFTADADLAPGDYTIELNLFQVADSDWNTTALATDSLTITVEAAGPTENVAEYVTNELALEVDGEVHNFTDVPVYKATTAATSFKLKAVYGENSKYLRVNDSEDITISNFTVEGEGEISFQVAIIGVPTGVAIDKLIVE